MYILLVAIKLYPKTGEWKIKNENLLLKNKSNKMVKLFLELIQEQFLPPLKRKQILSRLLNRVADSR